MNKTIVPVHNLSDDVLAAIVARDKVRKMNSSPSVRPHDFVTFFNELVQVRVGKNEKEVAKVEKQRKDEIHAYIKEHAGINNEQGELVGVIVD